MNNLIMLTRNITFVDMLKGHYKFSDKSGMFPNPFNLGLISNFYSIFKGHSWSWFWPEKIIHETDGTSFPKFPGVYMW